MQEPNQTGRSKLMLAAAMTIFGTVGIFRRYIPLPSSAIAMLRGLIGMLFLLLFSLARGSRPSFAAIRQNLFKLLLSGGLIGFHWILLFEAYQYATVATATLCYYMAPIFVVAVSPLVFKEKLTPVRIACVLAALLGMVLLSGVLKVGFSVSELRGVLLGLSAAVLYATVVILNKKLKNIGVYDRTIVQLGAAVVLVLPYTLLAENFSGVSLSPFVLLMLGVVGIVHTGVAYAMYFGSLQSLNTQTVALFSYIDPIVAVLASALVLHERMGAMEIVGAALVLLATLVSEFPFKSKQKA